MPKKKKGLIERLKKFDKLYSTNDKVFLSNHLKDKGEKQPKNWTLIHSEFCEEDELKKDVKPLLVSLQKKHSFTKEFNFAISITSNPDKDSFLDSGQFRVRYRYGIAANHIGEQLIKDNTREFCSALVRARKIYRREDISIMSFRGANPIANRNYSIFNLKGHWNCRHAWIREVFVIERDPAETENNPIVEKTRLMKNKNVQAAILKFKKATKGETLTAEEIVEVNKQLLEDQKFADEKVGDKILRIDGEVAEGTSVSWVDEEGEMTEVPNGDVTLEDGKVLTIKDGKISAVVEVESEEDSEVEAKLKKELEEVKAKLAKAEAGGGEEDKRTDLEKSVDAKLDAHFAKIDEKISNIPAFGVKKTTSKFVANKPAEEKEEKTTKRRSVNAKFSDPRKKD